MVVTSKVCGILALFCFVICGNCATLRNELGSEPFNIDKDGRYHFSYNLDDQSRQETGELKRIGDAVVYVVTGSYTFNGTNGKTYRVNYVADEKGYRSKTSNVPIDFEDRFNPEAGIDPTVLKTLVGRR